MYLLWTAGLLGRGRASRDFEHVAAAQPGRAAVRRRLHAIGRAAGARAAPAATTRPARHNDSRTRSRPIHSSRSPRLTTPMRTVRRRPWRATVAEPSASRRATRPRARTTTTTPTRSATVIGAAAQGGRPRAGAASRGRRDARPGARRPAARPRPRCVRGSGSGCARRRANRAAPLAAPPRGVPSLPSDSPARETRTSSGALPVFATRITARDDAGSTRRAGAAARATGGGTATGVAITCRSP